MQIISEPVALAVIKTMAKNSFGNLVKAVVDVEKKIMAVDAPLHADEEAVLIENGSKQENLWGINIYPDLTGAQRVEFDSMINLRPSAGNVTRAVDDPSIQHKILAIIEALIYQ